MLCNDPVMLRCALCCHPLEPGTSVVTRASRTLYQSHPSMRLINNCTSLSHSGCQSVIQTGYHTAVHSLPTKGMDAIDCFLPRRARRIVPYASWMFSSDSPPTYAALDFLTRARCTWLWSLDRARAPVQGPCSMQAVPAPTTFAHAHNAQQRMRIVRK